ncbi:hypothetical protein [Agromyces sp. NPDC058104]|uniref:hypothetical protein n=1 Tax=Agromyces sp. NPDC058104 TaxID=3346342 RepID=UPI0036DC00E0
MTVDEMEVRTLERWSEANELDALASFTPQGEVVIQDAETGRELVTLPDYATFEDFTSELDRKVANGDD